MKVVKVFLVSKDGSVFLREDGGFLEGEVQESEIPFDVAKRTLKTIGLDVIDENIKFFQKIPSIPAEDETYYFLLKNFHDSDSFRKISPDNVKTLSDEIRKILTPFFDGFRSWLLLPDAPEDLLSKIYRDYRAEILASNQPIALAAVGYTAAGKSSSIAGLARSIGALRISTDEFRARVFRAGYNFATERNYSNSLPPAGADELVCDFARQRYNLFLDFKAGNNLRMLKDLREVGYKIVLIYVNPPREWIERKIKNHSDQRHETFGGPDSLLAMMNDAAEKDDLLLEKLRNSEFEIWREIDPSRDDFTDQVEAMARDLLIDLETGKI